MYIVTAGQLRLRLIGLAVGLIGGLTGATWVHVINLNCEFGAADGLTIVSDCPGWASIFLSYAKERVSLFSGIVFIGGFASLVAGILAPWRPVASAVVFSLATVVNLAAILPAWLGQPQPAEALSSSILLVAIPLAMAALLPKWGQ